MEKHQLYAHPSKIEHELKEVQHLLSTAMHQLGGVNRLKEYLLTASESCDYVLSELEKITKE